MPSVPVIALLATIALSLLVLLWTFLRFSMGHGVRVLLRGLGLILVLVGSYVAGLMLLAAHGVLSLVDWARRTTIDDRMTLGLGLAGAGLVLFVIGSLLRSRSRERARESRAVRKGGAPADRQARGLTAAPAAGSTAPVAKAGRPGKPAKDSGLSDEDAEIEALLRNRGIN